MLGKGGIAARKSPCNPLVLKWEGSPLGGIPIKMGMEVLCKAAEDELQFNYSFPIGNG